ncbi:MFS transporter [Balneatrix alpica]|uniref:MFS transporter n=1 Tax=Balneatrix alpica TaxID=75684 RepID=A0ABV5Z8Q9_9GAMM|nr:MFS transporter [Balneatrix alpica]
MDSRQGLPYWRLSAFYAAYFALLGGFAPFWGLYLKDIGFSGSEIGQLMAIFMATRLVAPNLWGWLADKRKRRLGIIRLGALLSCLTLVLLWWARDFWQMALAMMVFTFFLNAVLPQFEVVTLQYLGLKRARYSQIRLWGSLGFVAIVVLVGWALKLWSIQGLPLLLVGLGVLMVCSTWLVQEPRAELESAQAGASFWARLAVPQVWLFYFIFMLAQISHGPFNTFYSIFMEEQGFDSLQIGGLWAVGVVAEILVFIGMHRLMRWGVARLMLWALAITVLRWLLVAAYPGWLPLVLFTQLMHAATFGIMHACGVHLVQQFFSGGNEGQGQALFSSFSYGVGGALGALLSGYVWQHWGHGESFAVAAVVALLAWLLAWRGLRNLSSDSE